MECSYGCLSNFDLPPPESRSGRNKLTVPFQKFSAEEAKPRTKAETIAYLKSQGEAFASFLAHRLRETWETQQALFSGPVEIDD